MIHKFFVAFIPIFVAIDPIGLVAVFMGLAGSASREERQRQGFVGIFTALCISVGFMFLGKIIFVALGITVADFQVAGGLILLGLAGRGPDVQLDRADATLLQVSLPQLAPGTYRVAWRVLSVDTHVTEGDFSFDVVP